ncbi:regulatory protein TetR [Mycolicibacterium rhodesiae JS60]|nr:regulatory protein TetR [Mycolicibacterium rhodesiae JS60]
MLTERILQAAREELATAGVDNFSIRQVAQRAGVTRKAVTARWGDAEELLRAALGAIDELQFDPTGDLSRDLTELGALFISGLESGALDLQLRVTADAIDHPGVYAELQRRVEEPMSRALARAFRAAQKSGQVRDGDVTWLVRAFVGSLLATTFGQPERAVPSSADLTELIGEIRKWAAPQAE